MEILVPLSRSSTQNEYFIPATPLAQSGDPPEYLSANNSDKKCEISKKGYSCVYLDKLIQ